MKKIYETAQIEIFIFDRPEVVVASSVSVGPSIDTDSDDLPILPAN